MSSADFSVAAAITVGGGGPRRGDGRRVWVWLRPEGLGSGAEEGSGFGCPSLGSGGGAWLRVVSAVGSCIVRQGSTSRAAVPDFRFS
jgi:hypothetical protein